MVDEDRLTLIYWDLGATPKGAVDTVIKAIKHLVINFPVQQTIITAGEEVMPNFVRKIADIPFGADIFIPDTYNFSRRQNNTLHHGKFVDTYTLVANIWELEQLFVFGKHVEGAICVGEFPESDFDYEDLELYPETWYTYY